MFLCVEEHSCFFLKIKSVSCHFCGENVHRCALIAKCSWFHIVRVLRNRWVCSKFTKSIFFLYPRKQKHAAIFSLSKPFTTHFVKNILFTSFYISILPTTFLNIVQKQQEYSSLLSCKPSKCVYVHRFDISRFFRCTVYLPISSIQLRNKNANYPVRIFDYCLWQRLLNLASHSQNNIRSPTWR